MMARARKFFSNRSGWFWFGFALVAGLIVILLFVGYLFYINRPVQVDLPRRSLPADNSYKDVILALERLTSNKPVGPISSPRPVSDWTLPELKQFSDAHTPDLDALDATMKDGPFVHPREYDLIQLRPNALFREGARRIASDIFYLVRTDNYNLAARRMMKVYELGMRYPNGGGNIKLMVGGAINQMALEHFHEILTNLDEGSLARMYSEMARLEELIPPYSDIVTEDRYEARFFFQQLWSQPHIVPGPFWCYSADMNPDVFLPFILEDKRRTFEVQEKYYDKIIEETSGPYRKFSARPSYFQLLTASEYEPSELDNRVFMIYCLYLAKHNVITTEIALRRYWLANRRYPASLEELTPKYLSKVPTDSLNDGKPMTYKQLDGGKDFLLYSYGANCKDDGGKDGKYRDPKDAADMVAGKWSK